MKDEIPAGANISNNSFYKSSIWKPFTIIYAFIVIADLVVISNPEWKPYREWSKPLILASLILFFTWQAYPLKGYRKWFMLLALLFSFAGDGFLNYEGYFLPGLLSFFTAHLFYILVFFQRKNLRKILHPLILPLILICALGVYFTIADNLNALKPYVVIYMMVLSAMVLSLLTRKGLVSGFSYSYGILGGILFLLSDSILAINKFAVDTFLGSQSIMLTYALAQYFLLLSFLTEKDS